MRSEPPPADTLGLQTFQVRDLHDVVQRQAPVAKPRANAHRRAALHMPGASTFTLCITLQNQSLRRHMRIHTGDKRFVCDICNKGFTQSHHLQNHTLVHTGDKPFTCEVSPIPHLFKKNIKTKSPLTSFSYNFNLLFLTIFNRLRLRLNISGKNQV